MAGKISAQRAELKNEFVNRLQLECSVAPNEASDK